MNKSSYEVFIERTLILTKYNTMKSIKTLLRITLIFLFAFGTACFSQTTHYITLHQDDDGLFSFTADENTTILNNESPKEFTILVYEDDTIEWSGITASGDEFDVQYIEFVSGENIFKSRKMNGNRENGNKKKVKAKVKKNKKGDLYVYLINFTIDGEDHSIDPKIKVGGGE